MPATIVSSTVVEDNPQRDTRRAIRERHLDSVGREYLVCYLALASFDAAAACAARAAQILADAGAAETAANIGAVTTLGSLAQPTFVYSTVAANVVALRAAYLIATQLQAVMIGEYLSTLTDAQLMSAFGLTQPQVTTLRSSKLTPAANIAANIRATTGA
jgi:hypothetical protein